MERQWYQAILVGLFASQVITFQAPRIQVQSRTKSLYYRQNRTDFDSDPTFSKAGTYHNAEEELAPIYNLEGLDGNHTVDQQLDVLDVYNLIPGETFEPFEPEEDEIRHFFEDGTPYDQQVPNLGMLKQWSQEYIDAVDMAGGMTRVSVGVSEFIATDYIFTSPTIGPINKQDFITLMHFYNYNGLDVASAVPDLTVSYTGWHQDPHEPWRVWAVARYSGTHTGSASVPNRGLTMDPPRYGENPVSFMTGPEMQSFLWTPEKKILWHTMGYVGDEYTGSNQGHGGLDGLMVSMGLPHLYLEATGAIRMMGSWLSQFKETDLPRSRSPYSHLPEWWHERKTFSMNVQK